jgi:hypothetical protein
MKTIKDCPCPRKSGPKENRREIGVPRFGGRKRMKEKQS